ncbi:3-oxoacyl-ACP synthase [Clostridium ganghwense]|uniref:3-oxoacyl-ACP synthase n=1 Tax=Clostridium ganghwense TaxID=312089 RepID=A0ABT4CSX1_9CLOT|nr:3-oxoacyl-ACP synthase [Clostridium ganghwense]MCY6372144.1 3-oxoacyl-ACP synthase [Clostridium ganghwense]
MREHVGIVGTGIYLPETIMTAKDVSKATKGVWSEEAVIKKLGFKKKYIASNRLEDGTQEMGVAAGRACLKNTGIDPMDIDLILCIGEEWKEYPLTTSGIYIQEKIGAKNAWAIDVQQRCCTTVAAIKIAKDMMLQDKEINTCMIVGGYRNGDFVDYTDKAMSMMYNLGAGGGAVILKKNYGKNEVLGTHIMSDGSLARDAGVEIGGTINPITEENLQEAYKSLRVMNAKHMKDALNEISMPNWIHCIDRALEKSGLTRRNIGYLGVLHFKYSMHKYMLSLLNLSEEQSIYLDNYGHVGQIDQILSLELAQKSGKLQEGTIVCLIAAGIGYSWSANVIRWGKVIE